MNRKQFALTLALAMVCACITGALTSSFLEPQPLMAQGTDTVSAKWVITQQLQLMDANGKERGRFGISADGLALQLILMAPTGYPRIALKVDQNSDPSLEYWDRNNQYVGSITAEDMKAISKGP